MEKIRAVITGVHGWIPDYILTNKELETTAKKLGNEAFLAKAPDAVVEKIRGRQQVAREEVERITKRLEELG